MKGSPGEHILGRVGPFLPTKTIRLFLQVVLAWHGSFTLTKQQFGSPGGCCPAGALLSVSPKDATNMFEGEARHAMACHGMPWHAVVCHGMPWNMDRNINMVLAWHEPFTAKRTTI